MHVAQPDTAYVDARLAALQTAIEQRMAATENANATSFRSVSQSSGNSSGSVAASNITGTITNAIDSVSAAIASLTATELVATNATTTNLYVSGTATIGSDTGLLQLNAGLVSALSNGSNGQVLKVVGGNLAWGSDLTGAGGGASAWATTTDDLALYPADTSQVVLIGTSATSTTGNILEVSGNSLLRGALTAYNSITAPSFTATSSSATSTFPRLNISGSLGLGSDYVTDLTGSGLTVSSGALTLDTSGTWSGNLGGHSATQLIASGFSTTSADAWSATRNFFASSSADYWQTTRNFFATSSADFWRTQTDFFSTSSVNYWKSVADLFSTSSAAYHLGTLDKGFFFSTTSADYWKSVSSFFSTSSAAYFVSVGLAFSTTSSDYWQSQRDFFSTSSAIYFAHSSTTIPKTYTANTFSALQTFANASTSILSASTLCLDTDCRTAWPSAGSSFDYPFPNNATSTLLNFNGGLTAYASSTIGNGSQSGGLTISGGATTTGVLKVQGTGTSTFAGDIGISGSIIPAADDTYSLGSASNMWKDVYIGPGSLYVNGKKVLEDVSNVITFSTDSGQNLAIETAGTGNITTQAAGSGNLNLLSGSGNINVTSSGVGSINISSASGNLNIGTSGSGQLNLGTITAGTWQGSVIGDSYLTKSGNWTGTLDGYEASQLLGAGFSTTSADVWKSERNFFATSSADYWKTVTDLFSTSSAIYFAHSSTTIPKIYTANTWTGSNTFASLTLASLNDGPLHANAGVLSATTSIGVLYGGTGLTSAPTYGQILVGNSSGSYTLTATSSLGLLTFAYPFPNNATSTTLTFSNGLLSLASTTIGNGTQTGGLTISGGATTTGYLKVLSMATSTFLGGLQAAALNVTSTSASSTFANGINLSAGCFSILGSCLGSGGSSQWTTSGSDIYYSTGNVGIGTTTPWAQLSVNPNGISGPAFAIGSSTATSFVVTNGGRIGIGLTTPSYPLDVLGDINFTGAIREDGNEIFASMIAPFAGSCPTGWGEYTAARGRTVVGTPSGGTNAGTVGSALTNLGSTTITDVPSHLHTVNPPSTNTTTDGAHTHGQVLTTQTGSGGKASGTNAGVAGSTDSSGSHSHSVDIASFNSGSTGVSSVDVTMPYIQLTYCQKAAGADIAEWIPASEEIGKAAIVSTDPDNRERVIASRKAYDNSVVGVVATQPGWLLGQETKESVQMALAGRVPMRVSLKNGEIKIGDPITTSSIPGVGMKATTAGPTVGKAMEAVNETSALTACTDPMTGRMEKCATALVFVNISWYSPTTDTEDSVPYDASNEYHEPLSIGADFETGDVVTLQYRYPQKQGSSTETVKTGYLMPAIPGEFAAGVISTEIGGPGELLRRVRENNKITQELRLIESGKAEMRISPNSPPINVGDPLTISPKDQGMGVRAEVAGFIIGRALEEWRPSNDKKTISVLLDASWYVPPSDETGHVHDDIDVETDDSLLVDLLKKILAWLSDAQNRVENLFAKNLYAENIEAKRGTFDELCVKDDAGMPVCVTGTQLRSLLSGSVLGASASSNDNEPPIDAKPADEQAAAIDATTSSTSPASDEAAADQTSPPAPDVMTTSPANDNAPPSSAEAI